MFKIAAGMRIIAAPLDTGGLTAWIGRNVVGLLVLVIGALVLASAGKKDHKSAAVMIGIVLMGLATIGLAANPMGVGTALSHLIFGA